MPFLPLFTGIRHLAHVLSVPPTKACLLCATPAGLDLYIQAMPVGTYRVQSPGFPKIVYYALDKLRSLECFGFHAAVDNNGRVRGWRMHGSRSEFKARVTRGFATSCLRQTSCGPLDALARTPFWTTMGGCVDGAW